MAMSRKDYQKLANGIYMSAADMTAEQWEGALQIVCVIATVLKQDNPRFVVDKFMAAAGVDEDHYAVSMMGYVTPRLLY